MSEMGNDHPEFTPPDIRRNAFESDVPTTLNPVIALDAAVMFISPQFSDRLEAETYHAQRRHDMLVQASAYYDDGHYSQAISELREIIRDLTIAGDTSHITDIETIIEHCWQCSARKLAEPAIRSSALDSKIAS